MASNLSQKTAAEKAQTRSKLSPDTATTKPIIAQANTPTREKGKESTSNASAAIMGKINTLEKIIMDMKKTMEEMHENSRQAKTNTDQIKAAAAADTDRLAALLTEGNRQKADTDRRLMVAERKLTIAEAANRKLETKINELENSTKSCLLRLEGKAEHTNENLHDYIMEIAKFLTTDGIKPELIISVHRLGRVQAITNYQERPRPILITFRDTYARNQLFYKRINLQTSPHYKGIFLNDEVSVHTRKMREDFRSVAALARDGGAAVRIHGDGIIIDGKKYKHEEADQLPDKFNLASAKTVEREEGIYFHSEHSFLSNFYPSPIVLNNELYPTAEHLYQTKKCQQSDNKKLQELIRNATTPLEAKRLASTIQETPEWRQEKYHAMESTLQLKFEQNPELSKKLVNTNDLPLFEATTDSYFGIGAKLHSRLVRDKAYTGSNKMGKALQNLRETLNRQNQVTDDSR